MSGYPVKDGVLGNRNFYKSLERLKAWKSKGRPLTVLDGNRERVPITGTNRQVILQYLEDMEYGLNVGRSSKRGQRSPYRVLGLTKNISRIAWLFHVHLSKDLVDLTKRDVVRLFTDMRNGVILTTRGTVYRSTHDLARVFKAFWHWYMKWQLDEHGVTVKNIVSELSSRPENKPPFVYFTLETLRDKWCPLANRYHKELWLFHFDCGARPPKETFNVRARDIFKTPSGAVKLRIRDETSKTFGRTINLLLSGDLMIKRISDLNLKPDDFLFSGSPLVANRYLKRVVGKVSGSNVTKGRKRYCDITLYDFRHSSACYWRLRYAKNIAGFLYRFGWSNPKMADYYTERLGMKDTIAETDLLDSESKTLLERDLAVQTQKGLLLSEQVASLSREIERLKSMSIAGDVFGQFLERLSADPELRKRFVSVLLEDSELLTQPS